MYKYMLEKLSAVNDIYDAPGNHLICLEGKKGTGKSSVLREFASKHRDVIQVEAISSNENYLAPIINALHLLFGHRAVSFRKLTNHNTTTKAAIGKRAFRSLNCRLLSAALCL